MRAGADARQGAAVGTELFDGYYDQWILGQPLFHGRQGARCYHGVPVRCLGEVAAFFGWPLGDFVERCGCDGMAVRCVDRLENSQLDVVGAGEGESQIAEKLHQNGKHQEDTNEAERELNLRMFLQRLLPNVLPDLKLCGR